MSALFPTKQSVLAAAGLAALFLAICWASLPRHAQISSEVQAKATGQPSAPVAKTDDLDRRLRRIERAIERLGGKLDDNLDPNIVQAAPEARIEFGPPITITPIDSGPYKPAIDLIAILNPAEAENELKALKKKRVELVEKLLETFDEIRAIEAKIALTRKRFFDAPEQ